MPIRAQTKQDRKAKTTSESNPTIRVHVPKIRSKTPLMDPTVRGGFMEKADSIRRKRKQGA